jgi:hypothetical protein
MRQLFETRDFQETGLQPMADPAGLSAAVLVGSYEVRCVPVSDSEYYTKSNGFSGKIMGVSSRWFSISLRPLRSS